MGSVTPLLDRIERKHRTAKVVVELRRQPRWLARLQPKDMTESVLVNGAWQRPEGPVGA